MNRTVIASECDGGLRLDKLLAQYFPDRSRTYFQYLIDQDHVLLNGHPVKKQHPVSVGDQIEISFQLTPELDVAPEEIPLDVLYEDESVILVNKPAGMVVHPAPGSPSGTFAAALMHHCRELDPGEFDALRPGIVHRLDKETSGVMIAAKTRAAHQALIEQFASRQVEKTYLAICCGVPREGVFSAPIKRHPIHRKQMTASQDGKEAVSSFKVLAHHKGLSLVEVRPLTGRTHQIRVHLKTLGCPVLGDRVYGSKRLNEQYGANKGQMLHASQLKLRHPLSQTPLEATAPLPDNMKNFIEIFQHV